MIDALYITAEDAIRTKKSGEMITEGMPVSLDSNGELIGATSGSAIYGVSKLDSNEYRDFAYGEFGAFGTGKLTIVTKGTVKVQDSVYSGIEVTQQTTEGSEAKVLVLADGVTFAVNEMVYANDNGQITNTGTIPFGRVLSWDGTAKVLEIEVDAIGLAA